MKCLSPESSGFQSITRKKTNPEQDCVPTEGTCFQLDSPRDGGRVKSQRDVSSVQVDPAHTTEQVLVRGDGVVVVGHRGMRRLGAGELSRCGGDLSVLGHRLPSSDAPCSEQKEMSQTLSAVAKLCPQGVPAAKCVPWGHSQLP